MVGEPSRVQKSFGTSVIIFLKFEMYNCTFICAYNVHCNIYFLATVLIYFLLDSGGGKGSYKALAASPQPEDSES